MGGRGVGKTFDYKSWALTDKEHGTAWIRRYGDDFNEEFYIGFVKDLIEHNVIDGDRVKIKSRILYLDGRPKVYFIPLNLQHKLKGINFNDVDKIIFDEFAEIKTWKYLPNEVTEFLEMIETINRLRGPGKEVRVFMLANKISWVNPYSKAWGIKPFTQRFKHFHDGLLVVENWSDPEFVEAKKQTKFGQFIEKTNKQYFDYAINNIAWQDDNAYIAPRPKDSDPWVNVRVDNRITGIWYKQGVLYCSHKYDPQKPTYAAREDQLENELSLLSHKEPIKSIKDYSAAGKLFYEDNTIKSDLFEIELNSFS